MMISRYNQDDTWMGDEAQDATIHLSRVNHDMIAQDTLEDRTNRNHHQNQLNQQHRSLLLCYRHQHSRDPYRWRSLAMTMHWFLTKVCRLQPHSSIESTSTLSYNSQTITLALATPSNSIPLVMDDNDDEQNNNGMAHDGKDDNSNGSMTRDTKKKLSTVQFKPPSASEHSQKRKKHSILPATSSPINTDDQQYLAPLNTYTLHFTNHFSTGSLPLSSISPPMQWDSPGHPAVPSDSPTSSSFRLSRQSKKKKLRHAMLQQNKGSKATVLSIPQPLLLTTTAAVTSSDYSPTSSISSTSISSSLSPSMISSTSRRPSPLTHVPGQMVEEDIDRLSLLSWTHSIESPSNNGYEPLTAPPWYYHRRRLAAQSTSNEEEEKDLPTLSITLPDQLPDDNNNNINSDDDNNNNNNNNNDNGSDNDNDNNTMQSSATASPWLTSQSHGVEMDSSVIRSLMDWGGPTNTRTDQLLVESDGIENGWTTLIHIRHAWEQNSNSGYRKLHFVEHWVKDYLGSRWFVFE
ncbi:hypothetical protein BC941DRAFT_161176 [Chlamydoabsidia padenii]|nr:hypothetical protein BC941DRAFT_161176 [Chlamydoabsidia padenii]